MNTIRVMWAAPWSDRPEKSMVQIDHIENGVILRQFIMSREQAEGLADDILKLVMEPR